MSKIKKFDVKKRYCTYCSSTHYTPDALEQCEAECKPTYEKKWKQGLCEHKLKFSIDRICCSGEFFMYIKCPKCDYFERREYNADKFTQEVMEQIYETMVGDGTF